MRKLFRFKYEPCHGDCYAWCDFLPQELNKLDEEERKSLVATMVKAHNSLCDNPEYSFGVDFDKETQIFVAHFRTPTFTDTMASDNFRDCVQAVCTRVLATDIPKVEGACSYGDNGAEDLGTEILRACTDEVYRKAHHDSCSCKVA